MFAFTLVNSDVREVLMEMYCNATNNMIDVCVCVCACLQESGIYPPGTWASVKGENDGE